MNGPLLLVWVSGIVIVACPLMPIIWTTEKNEIPDHSFRYSELEHYMNTRNVSYLPNDFKAMQIIVIIIYGLMFIFAALMMYQNRTGKGESAKGFCEKFRQKCCHGWRDTCAMFLEIIPYAFVFTAFVFDIVAMIMLEVNYDYKNDTTDADWYFHFYEGGVTVVRDLAYVMIFFIYKDSVFECIDSNAWLGTSSSFSLYSPVSLQESRLHTSGLMKSKKFVEIDYDM